MLYLRLELGDVVGDEVEPFVWCAWLRGRERHASLNNQLSQLGFRMLNQQSGVTWIHENVMAIKFQKLEMMKLMGEDEATRQM
jgi:hypothetical protein